VSQLCKECGCDAEGLVSSLDEMDTLLGEAQAEIERLKNGEFLVKLHNALLLEGEKTKALLRQTEEQRAEIERLRPDAERYRLHRTGNHSDVLMEVPPGSDNWEPLVGDHLDKATDAAREGE